MLCFCCLFCSTKTKDLPNDLKKLLPEHRKYLEHALFFSWVFISWQENNKSHKNNMLGIPAL